MTPAVSHLHTSQVIRLWCILSHRWTEEMTGNMDRWINAGQKGIGDKLFTCCQSMIQFTIRQKDSQQQKKQEMFLLLKRNRSERWSRKTKKGGERWYKSEHWASTLKVMATSNEKWQAVKKSRGWAEPRREEGATLHENETRKIMKDWIATL